MLPNFEKEGKKIKSQNKVQTLGNFEREPQRCTFCRFTSQDSRYSNLFTKDQD